MVSICSKWCMCERCLLLFVSLVPNKVLMWVSSNDTVTASATDNTHNTIWVPCIHATPRLHGYEAKTFIIFTLQLDLGAMRWVCDPIENRMYFRYVELLKLCYRAHFIPPDFGSYTVSSSRWPQHIWNLHRITSEKYIKDNCAIPPLYSCSEYRTFICR